MPSIRPLHLDLKFVLRQLWKSPAFTTTAVLMLALGIGATVAIFSIVEGVLLRPVAFDRPEQLVILTDQIQGSEVASEDDEAGVTAQEIVGYTRESKVFANVGAYELLSTELSDSENPARINLAHITAGLLPTLGVRPLLGRTFSQEEIDHDQKLVVLSYRLWKSHFQADPDILGKKIQLSRQPYTVVGVMPQDFEFPIVSGRLNQVDLWTPLRLTDENLIRFADSWKFSMVARLRPGISLAEVQSAARQVAEDAKRYYPPATATNIRINPQVRPLQDDIVKKVRPQLKLLLLAVVVVLLIVCANLAGLLLVRSIRRQKEIALRLALGASGATILRQVMLESLLLSLSGGLLGSLLAILSLYFGRVLLPDSLPRASEISVNWTVLGIALFLSVATALICGLAPAFVALRTGILEPLKEGGRSGSAGKGHTYFRSALVVAEIAISFMLLSAAGLLLRSFDKMRTADLGFRPDHITTAFYSLPYRAYTTQAAVTAFDREIMRRLRELPGVESVGITTSLPILVQESDYNSAFTPEGYVPANEQSLGFAAWALVQGDYFRTMGIPLLRGRFFTPEDRENSQLAVIINKKLADHYWPHQDPVGKRLHYGGKEAKSPWLTVVGVIADVKLISPDAAIKEQLYQPLDQVESSISRPSPDDIWGNFGDIVVRSTLPPEQMENSLRTTVRSIDPQLPLAKMQTMEEVVSNSQGSRRFHTALVSSFALAAVLLALLGIYSVIAYSAAARTREMAIRIALGSQRAKILGLVLLSGAKLTLLGCAAGLLGAIAISGILRSFLFGVSPFDPTVLFVALASVFLLAMLATAIPGLRVLSIRPMMLLRSE